MAKAKMDMTGLVVCVVYAGIIGWLGRNWWDTKQQRDRAQFKSDVRRAVGEEFQARDLEAQYRAEQEAKKD